MRQLVILASIFVVALTSQPLLASAQGATRVIGGGTGTFNADLDGDGEIDGSQFGMGVTIHDDGSAQGHFNCIMAGQSDILGLALMSVAGKVSAGNTNPDGTVTFKGTGSVKAIAAGGGSQILTSVPFTATVTEGGPGVGTLTLTVIGAFDGIPGDTNTGNSNYDLPTETVENGSISID